MTQSKALAASLLALSLFAASPALAQVQVLSMTAPTTIPNPYNIFTINYTLTGSKFGLATAQIRFYLSTTRTGTGSRVQLHSGQILLGSAGGGLYRPPAGTQSISFMRATVDFGAQPVLDAIAAGCQPEGWFIQAEVDYGIVQGDDTLIGTTKPPDFTFTGGTLSPATIQPGGTTNFSFDLYSRCPANSASTVGVFLADANYQLLSYLGGIPITAGSGTWSLPATPLTFSPAIATGSYTIILLADVDGVVPESNENNNAGAFSLEIVPAPLSTLADDTTPLTTDVAVPVDTEVRAAHGAAGVDGYLQAR
ncbi:CARDB domain-containing protein [Myxococcus eversor]|uniref:CARDB domain-containing protein n=1 Tax=Myxococcus eversor TaxID=2709661 RepID=UPI0013D2D06D|nr:CARDB domain-containing protein [Myxococcus eversor]